MQYILQRTTTEEENEQMSKSTASASTENGTVQFRSFSRLLESSLPSNSSVTKAQILVQKINSSFARGVRGS